jgi:UDP-3-O-acyl-N-acetylglucosamine deacetylase
MYRPLYIVGGSMDFRLHYLRFADEEFVAHSMLYSISDLVSPGTRGMRVKSVTMDES